MLLASGFFAFSRIGSAQVKIVNAIHDSINLYNNTWDFLEFRVDLARAGL
jgi:hypothetical protein